MPAVADIQNTIVKEFEGDPRVVTAIMSQGESASLLETFFRNVYLRGTMIYDPDGGVAEGAYGQPYMFLPASRAWVIGPDGKVVLAHMTHNPELIVDTIYERLVDMSSFGDFDGDGQVGPADFLEFESCYSGPGGGPLEARCGFGDSDGDSAIDCADWAAFASAWTASGEVPVLLPCSGSDPIALSLERAPAGTRVCWTSVPAVPPYTVVRGDLDDLAAAPAIVDLGPAVCIEAASLDACNDGNEDPVLPEPGRGHFYLVGYRTGSAVVYGEDASGRVRSASGGGCP